MFLKELDRASSPSGYEGQVRKLVKNEAAKYCDDLVVDRMGNIIAHKKGEGIKIALTTNIDEIGFIINTINEDGTLKFFTLGNIDKRVIPGKKIFIGKNKIPGIIGIKPIHLQTKEERGKIYPIEELFIDIGTYSKKQTEKIISVGDYAVFATNYNLFGDKLIKGKAVGNRIGCSILLDILKENYHCDLYGIFNTQGEVGMRGAFTSSYKIKPDIVISIGPIWSNDIPGVNSDNYVSELKKGPTLIVIDSYDIYDIETIEILKTLSEKNNINIQSISERDEKLYPNTFAVSGRGCRTVKIGIPCRYLNSPNSICSYDDYENTVILLKEYLRIM
ncbi:M42 family metallopeptidase [Clostridium sp. DL1XJH146]